MQKCCHSRQQGCGGGCYWWLGRESEEKYEVPRSCLQTADGRVREWIRGKEGTKEKTVVKRQFLLLVLNSSPELKGLRRAEKKSKQRVSREVTAQIGHGIPARLSRLGVVLESCHLGEKHESLTLVLLVLLDLAPLWFYTVTWEGFAQVPSVRWFCQPQLGSILPLQSIKGHFDYKEKQLGSFRGRITLRPQQLCQFIGFMKFKLSIVTWFELLGNNEGWSGTCAFERQLANLAFQWQAIHFFYSGVSRSEIPLQKSRNFSR